MRLTFKIIGRFFRTQNFISKVTLGLSILGVVLGVACLVVAMSVVSGVQVFMQKSVTDLTGHYLVLNRAGTLDVQQIAERIQTVVPVQAVTPFVSSQGLLVQKGQLTGIMLHGLHLETAFDVLSVENKVISGKLKLNAIEGESPPAAIGKELAKKFHLKVGDSFNVIVPKLSSIKTNTFSPRKKVFQVSAILDFGKFDYNDKVILAEDSVVQALTEIGQNYLGAYVTIQDYQKAPQYTEKISEALGRDYRVRSWWDLNQNFFTAAELEKVVIFIVILFIVIVASLNISSTLFISILRKYFDIAILKTLGATEKFLVRLFVLQGLIISVVSTGLGLLVGVGLSLIIKHTNLIDVPGQIYNFDHLPVQIRFTDLFLISTATILICLISSWIPARKGARQKPTEGLKYESV